MREQSDFLSASVWGPVPQAPRGQTWENLMRIALDMAKRGAELGEIPVGAVVCGKDGRILAKAHNRSIRDSDPTAHAEIVALREAGKVCGNYRLSDCFLIVTLEPCIMCTGAVREARLAGIVFGAYDKRAGAVCSCQEGLNCPELGVKTWHYGGVMADRAAEILQDFFKDKRQ